MKLLRRNKKQLWYCLYEGERIVRDGGGYETGEKQINYGAPVMIKAHVSPATGYVQRGVFGNLEAYDKVIIVEDVNCPIDEHTVLFVDRDVEFEGDRPLFDYVVKRVAHSLNHLSLAISKVTTS